MNLVKFTKLTVHHYRVIYTASMGFFPYGTEIRLSKIPPIALFEQIAKYWTCHFPLSYTVRLYGYSYRLINIQLAS